jgi:hypothetical protein
VPKFRFEGVALEHYEAICRMFISRHQRARRLTRHDAFEDELNHRAPGMFDPRRVLAVSSSFAASEGFAALVKDLGRADRGVYFGDSSLETGEHALDECLDELQRNGGALVSVIPGVLAVGCSEPVPDRDWYLLISDDAMRARAERALASAKRR